MDIMSCPCCTNGRTYSFSGGNMMMSTCAVCAGSGRVQRRARLPAANGDCPYHACGGKCFGTGKYAFRGTTIWCEVGPPAP